MVLTREPDTASAATPERGTWVAAAVGVGAGALTLGTAELLAAAWVRLVGSAGVSSPLLAVGGAFVDLTPPWLKDFAVETFGTADKLALGVGMAVVLILLCAAIGVLTLRRRPWGTTAFTLVGVVGAVAVFSRPATGVLDLVPTVVGVGLGAWLLGRLVDRLRAADSVEAAWAQEAASEGTGGSGEANPVTGATRRAVLVSAGGLTALGAVGILAGQALATVGRTVQRGAEALGIPVPTRTVSVPEGAGSDVGGHSAYVTPNEDYYRIDTALRVPRVDAANWSLRVTGLVDEEIEISYADLMEEEHVEALVTLTCVSNQVGGDLVGNAVWQGWPIRELLARAGVQPEADMVLSRSTDGWTAGTPIEALTDERDALLAVAMNGEPLPAEHGFPVRMVVPGLYGYVSATKWVTELKVTRFDADEGYWTPRGWAELGPIKTASRIDVPREGRGLAPDADGAVVFAGVAWAQHRGIDRVEVQVDGGQWEEASLMEEPSVDSWRLWTHRWVGEPGEHSLAVRATDGTGEVQTDISAPPAPDGASGWHRVGFQIG
ncbi:molybdopterin-dependent oxidoreductase [Ornithinimicrobium sp. LYQ92]|uniref:molybdopterin-dependent oxidoreductase n=1 Tax=Serinicoccus sp. LYQ92 TaxID=3378798 RepID=UPI003852E919